jgi:hypothetical protein
LPASKAFLEISPGARLVSDLPEPDQKLQPGVKLVPLAGVAQGKWVKVQPKTAAPVHGSRHAKPVYNDAGTPVWVDSSLANTTATAIVPAWKSFPLSVSNAKGPGADFRDVFRSVELEKNSAGSVAKDDKGRRWYYVKIGAKDGGTRDGWVCEQDHPLVRMCGPWDWPGFELVDNSSIKPVDMLKRYIHVAEQFLADEDKTEFETSAATVNASPLISKLEKAIDANHDGKVTAQELKHAQEIQWTAEALSHLVVRCESEWGGGLGKWEALSPLMKKLLWLWKTEIERIGKLQWWEQVTSVDGFPKEPCPWHFHPIGIVGNFIAKPVTGENNFTEEDAKDALKYIFDKYGRTIAETVERMYRTETRHFQSSQYRRCGTGGMEVHGPAPYYGWTPDFYSEPPIGTWAAFEGAGLSGVGGNAQVTDRKKVFVVVSSVRVGMEFKAKYIVHYNGNYARWFSTDASAQAIYRKTLESITPRIVNSFQ